MDSLLLQMSQLLRKVSDVSDPESQLREIVDSISGMLAVDVCSVYLLNEKNEPTLYASHGLISKKPVSLSTGKGLIGKAIETKSVVNVANAEKEHEFEPVPSTGELRFKSFCAVPLIKQGICLGGLVVQSKKEEVLEPQLEALLVTLAAQLAWLLPSQKVLEKSSSVNLSIEGLKGAKGIAVGAVHLLTLPSLDQVKIEEGANPSKTKAEWKQVKALVKTQLSKEKSQVAKSALAGEIIGIFDIYQLLLDDSAFNHSLDTELQSGLTLAGAIKKTVMALVEAFEAIEDEYLASRAEDMLHLGNKIIRVIDEVEGNRHTIPDHPVILFANEVSVSDIALFGEGQVLAILCAEGSLMSHTAILANAIGIPALLGLGGQLQLEENERVIVDADSGKLIRFPSDSLCREYRGLIKHQYRENEKLKELKDLPALTLDGARIHLLANSGLLNDLEPSLQSGAEGIGLYRTEIPFMSCSAFPTETEQVAIYKELFSAFADQPVFVRVLDIGGDKQLPYFPIKDEQNPALGWRGIRFCLDNTAIFRTQLTAILRASIGYQGLHILAPMVSDLEQIQSFKALITESIELLKSEGLQVEMPKVGCMIEVPAAISQIPLWAEELDFISIGSNDLCQYLLSVDRNNPRVAGLFDSTHPAILHEIKRIVDLANTAKLDICLCGEMASDPRSVVLLIGYGIRKLSLGAAQLPRIKKLIRNLEASQCKDLADQVRKLRSSTAIKKELDIFLSKLAVSH
ncbi:phosphoenolpyruvate--protein phosphotransferase [uncultured Neptuniibacter sp.]|uniref:phosphoenolpyruvate--protein phosphotransferase n=1 Tax=uncultured Neptuniibacter sp. TaxID=502143 RepID=UPI002610147A|nr:phosphoenolpyruvate--protein phosphotransferase [uncultured Neptuniibacter sp.]